MKNGIVNNTPPTPSVLKNKRNSSIDLLKIVSMIGVIILHYNNAGIGQAFVYVPMYSLKSYAIYFLQAVSVAAVNVFVLISGYFMCKTKAIDLRKPARLLFQVIVYRIVYCACKDINAGGTLTVTKLLPFLLPTSWFAVLYVCLYCLSPFINKLIDTLDEKDFKKLLEVCFLLFSVWPWCVDVIVELSKKSFNGLSTIGMYGSQGGYTIVNFIMMYLFGAYIRVTEKRYNVKKCVFGQICCCIQILFFSYLLQVKGFNRSLAYEYCSPAVVLSAVFAFLIFQNFNIRYNPVINSISKSTFSVYLLNSYIIADVFNAEKYVLGNGYFMLAHICAACVVICVVSWVSQVVFDWIMNLLAKLINMLISVDSTICVK